MHDRVARVEEDPVAERHSLDFRGRIAGVATGLDDPVGDRGDVNSRPSGGDNHSISERRLPRKFDRDDVLRLCVFESTVDDLRERARRRFVPRGGIAALRRRTGMKRNRQRRAPLGAEPIRPRPKANMWRESLDFKLRFSVP